MFKMLKQYKNVFFITIIVATVIALVLTVFDFISKKDDTVMVDMIDFVNTSNEELSKLEGKTVCVYGYFVLNPPVEHMAYIAEVPFQTIHNKDIEKKEYATISLKDTGIIPIFFQHTNDLKYSTEPFCFVARVEKKENYDSTYYVYSEYALVDAVYKEVDTNNLKLLSNDLAEFKIIAKTQSLDATYINIIELLDFLENTSYKDFDKNNIPKLISAPKINEKLKNIKETDNVKTVKAFAEKCDEIKKEIENIASQEDINELCKKTELLYEEFNKFIDKKAVIHI